MRWVTVAIVGIASAGLLAVSICINLAFGSSFGRTALEAYAYGAAFAFADVLKVAAPIVIAKSIRQRQWGAATLGVLVWGTFTMCSGVSAIGFASANRTFAVDARTVQAALNQSRLRSLEADQSELRRLRDRLALPELGRSERHQMAAASQRLEAAIGETREKLEDAAPVVSTPNPQAHALAAFTGAGIDSVEIGLILLVALLVEMGGLGPFITMRLANSGPKKASAKVPVRSELTAQPQPAPKMAPPSGRMRPRLVYSEAGPEHLEGDLGRFLNLHTRAIEGSTLGSTDLLGRYNGSRRNRGYPEVTQRRFGDAMNALGHLKKLRLSGGRVHYQGLAWAEADCMQVAA
jgi:hypothetical protein